MASIDMHMPKIVRNRYGLPVSDRTTEKLPGLDSAALYLGQFVPYVTGGLAAPDGIEFGVPAYADDTIIGGIVVGFSRLNGILPIWEDDKRAGTVTQPTGELPLKYTFSSTNDGSNVNATLEQVEVLPIFPGDVIEVTLWGASTASVNRGTTVAAGTTDSTANFGVGLEVSATYPFALLESTGDKDLEDCDFMTWVIDGQQPVNLNRVFVTPIRSFGSYLAVQS